MKAALLLVSIVGTVAFLLAAEARDLSGVFQVLADLDSHSRSLQLEAWTR